MQHSVYDILCLPYVTCL